MCLMPMTAAEGVYRVLRAAILDGTVPPGGQLRERDIATDLGVSRSPLREALTRLEEEGLKVELAPKVSQGRPNVLDFLREGKIQLIINTPTRGKRPARDGFKIRRTAIELGTPYITTIRGAEAAVNAIESIKKGAITVRSINEYQARVGARK